MVRLGVNIDHIATVRQARGTIYPDPLQAALIASDAGADGITLHLREDRRHIQDRDVELIKQILLVPMNLEMATTEEMIAIAEKIKPAHCCLVPEKRNEVTTEGGLDVAQDEKKIRDVCQRLATVGIEVSLFIDPNHKQIEAAKRCGASTIELHTGQYAEAETLQARYKELQEIITAANFAHEVGLIVNAGHGLHYHNVQPIAAIAVMNELNIGHSIIARALFSGLAQAVREMKCLMLEANFNYQSQSG